jgi:CRISPR system Cascade subunit CasD
VRCLTSVLAAPLAACGDQSVAEIRGTWSWPGHSAVFGLIAACLGIDRADEGMHTELQRDYGVALRVECCGPVLRDYHTAQMPARQKGVRYATRRQELLNIDGNDPVVTERFYLQDVVVFTALWERGFVQRSLEEIAEAMRAPSWIPYFGRRCCPFALPLDPQIVEAENPVAALSERAASDRGLALLGRTPNDTAVVTLDAADARHFGLNYQRVELRRDALASRRRWQFNLREEAVL